MRHNMGAAASLQRKMAEPSTLGHSTEVAHCEVCRDGTLEFILGGYGQTLEVCTNRQCVNHIPHRPQPTDLGPSKRNKPGDGKKAALLFDSYTK